MTTNNNQNSNSTADPTVVRVRAIYHEDAAYKGVPLSESLPLLEEDEGRLIKKLSNYPDFDPSKRQHSKRSRLQYLKEISTLVHPQNRHIAEYKKIDGLLNSGYYARNMYRNGRIHIHNYPIGEEDNYPHTADEQVDYISQQKKMMHNAALVRNTALLAHSGMGKTTLINSILNCYPQVIEHSEYRDQPFLFQQLVWLKLECPFDGSHKQVMKSLFKAIDRTLGTNFSETHSDRVTVDELIGNLQTLNLSLRIGFIVIDEIQRLNKVSRQASNKMLEFLVQFSNTVKVPLMYVGTLEAEEILTADLQQTRRIIGEGNFIWNPPANDSTDWRSFLSILFMYQYVRCPIVLDEVILAMMHKLTKGIADFAVKLFILTQKHLIETATSDDEERITPEILAMVAAKEFDNITPHLKQVVVKRHDNGSFTKTVKQYEQAYQTQPSLLDYELDDTPSSVNLSASIPPLPMKESEKKSPKKRKQSTRSKKKTEAPSLRNRNVIYGSSDYLSGTDKPDA